MSSPVHTLFHVKCTFFIERVRVEIMSLLCYYVLTPPDASDCSVLSFMDKQGSSIQKPRKRHHGKIDILCQLGARIVGWEVGEAVANRVVYPYRFDPDVYTEIVTIQSALCQANLHHKTLTT